MERLTTHPEQPVRSVAFASSPRGSDSITTVKTMPEIIGIDHIYVAVSDMAMSEKFYDVALGALDFRKHEFSIGGERHVQYFNRHFGYVLRPARSRGPHEPYAPGLHHFCLRVASVSEVREAAMKLKEANIAVSEPRLYPEYAPDYFAVFFSDPDGIRLEITNYRLERRERHDHW